MSNRKKPKNRKAILAGMAQLKAPIDEKVLLKEVPAMVDDMVVGKALLFDDGSVDVIWDRDAPEAAKQRIQEELDKINAENETNYTKARLGMED